MHDLLYQPATAIVDHDNFEVLLGLSNGRAESLLKICRLVSGHKNAYPSHPFLLGVRPTDTAVPRSIVRDGENGIIVQPRQATEIVAALEKLTSDKAALIT
jgi:hypothetical protein